MFRIFLKYPGLHKGRRPRPGYCDEKRQFREQENTRVHWWAYIFSGKARVCSALDALISLLASSHADPLLEAG